MQGTAASTLAPLAGADHIVQSIRDIIMTPIGARVLRRDYGSAIPALLDRPINDETRLDFAVGVAEALDRWEPRVRVERVRLAEAGADGAIALDLDLTFLADGESSRVRIAL